MNINLLNDEGRFIVSPDRPEAPLHFRPLEFGSVEPVKLRVFENGNHVPVAVDPSTYSVELLVGTPNIRPSLGFWAVTTTMGDSLGMPSRATKEEVETALVPAFGPVTVEGGQGSYIVTLVNNGEQTFNAQGVFDGVTISDVRIFENTPGTDFSPAQYRIEVLEVAPAGISPGNWTIGSASPSSSITQIDGRLWQFTLGQSADAGFFNLTVEGVTTGFISAFSGSYQIEMALSAAGKPAEVRSDMTGGFYVNFAEDVTTASVGGHLVSLPSLEGSLDLTTTGLRELLDGKQFTPVTLTVVLTKDGQTTRFSKEAILQMPINTSALPRYLTESAADSRYARLFPHITALTGGGAGSLDGIVTLADAVSVGTPVVADVDDKAVVWRLCQLPISAISIAAAAVVTTTKTHGFTTGQTVTIGGSNCTPSIDGDRVVTVLSSTTFSVPVTTTVAGSTGYATPAEDTSTGVVWPYDFNASTNAVFWQSVL